MRLLEKIGLGYHKPFLEKIQTSIHFIVLIIKSKGLLNISCQINQQNWVI